MIHHKNKGKVFSTSEKEDGMIHDVILQSIHKNYNDRH